MNSRFAASTAFNKLKTSPLIPAPCPPPPPPPPIHHHHHHHRHHFISSSSRMAVMASVSHLPKASRLSCWMHISMLQVESVDEFLTGEGSLKGESGGLRYLSLGLDPPLSHIPVPSPEDRSCHSLTSPPTTHVLDSQRKPKSPLGGWPLLPTSSPPRLSVAVSTRWVEPRSSSCAARAVCMVPSRSGRRTSPLPHLDRMVEIPAMNLQAVDTLLNVLPACDLLEGRDHPIPVEPHR